MVSATYCKEISRCDVEHKGDGGQILMIAANILIDGRSSRQWVVFQLEGWVGS
jgi:hypothetical protein